ncbi:MAG TPA: polysaccharide deacetylase family protein [Planctomycetaceae bacterium]|nr:polysaccharide deacetylase family protein [Planctomycetaceae bacterium]
MVPSNGNSSVFTRRRWNQSAAAACLAGLGFAGHACGLQAASTSGNRKAQIAITLDLEMSRNFPRREDLHWDYKKGNLNDATKRYAVDAGQRVKERGGRIHYFCVGRVLEQPDVTWLQQIADDGHPIGNHTYDHVNVLAQKPSDLQFRFQRSPWLIEGRSPADVIQENIRITTLALKQRIGIDNRGFRTPGGFNTGLNEREDLQQILLDLGFKWVSSVYPAHANTGPQEQPSEVVYNSIVAAQAKSQPFVYPTGLIEIPMSPISDIGAFRTGQWKLEWFLEAVRRAVVWTIENEATFDFLAHPSCLGVVDPELKTIDMICDLVKAAGESAEIVDLDQIASATAPA